MKSKIKKIVTLACMLVTIACLGLFLYQKANDTEITAADTDVTLNASVTDGLTSSAHVLLNWTYPTTDSAGNTIEGLSFLYKIINGEATPIPTIDYSNVHINVLNLSPWSRDNSNFNNVEKWLNESTVDENGNATTYSRGQMTTTTYTLSEFNANPSSILKKENGQWNYDVIIFGFADANSGGAGGDLTEAARDIVKSYLNDGKGAIFGHDTIVDNACSYPYFRSLAGYVGVNIVDNVTYLEDDTVKILRKSLFTTYPNLITESELIIPASHTLGQQVTNGMSFLEFKTGGSTVGTDSYPSYLTVYKNCALIQTGHSGGASTSDERRIIANLIFYLNGISDVTSTDRPTDIDTAAPMNPYTGTTVKGTTVGVMTQLASDDIGTKYKYKVEVYDKDNMSNIIGEDTKDVTVTSGYDRLEYYFCDTSQNAQDVLEWNKSGNEKIYSIPLAATSTGGDTDMAHGYSDETTLTANGKTLVYRTYDKAGNISNMESFVCNFSTKLTIDANGGKFSDNTTKQTINSARNQTTDYLPIPTREGYEFAGYNLTSSVQSGTILLDNPQDSTQKIKFQFTNYSEASLVATWNLKNYSIKFDYGTNAGSTPCHMDKLPNGTTDMTTVSGIQEASYPYGATVGISEIPAYKEGWEFVGWSLYPNSTETISEVTIGTSTTTVYAVYKKQISATFYYYSDETQMSESKLFTIYNLGTASHSATTPNIPEATIDGNTYVGFGWVQNDSSVIMPNETSRYISPGTSIEVSDGNEPIYYALYQRVTKSSFTYYDGTTPTTIDKSTIVCFNTKNKDIKSSSFGTSPSIPNTCRIDGLSDWTILGWTTGSAGNSSIDLDEDASYNVALGNHYYALYSRKVTVNYDLNGGYVASTIPNGTGTKYINAAGSAVSPRIKVTNSVPFTTGKEFSGLWYNKYNPSLTYLKNTAYEFTEDTTLVAQWGAEETTKRTINILWNDWNNRNNSRPTQIQIKLTYPNGAGSQTISLTGQNLSNSSAINQWTGVFSNIPEGMQGGTLSVVSCSSKNKYIVYSSKINGDTIIFTASPVEGTYSIPLTLKWYDTYYGVADYYGYRPSNIYVNVLQGSTGNEQVVKTYRISKNSTSQKLENLTYYDSLGFPFVYDVRENDIDRYSQSSSDETSLDASNPYIVNHALTLTNKLYTTSAMSEGLNINTAVVNQNNKEATGDDYEKIGLQNHTNYDFTLTLTNIGLPSGFSEEKINVIIADDLTVNLKGLPVGKYAISQTENMNFDFNKVALKTDSSYVTLTETGGSYILEIKKGINFSDTATLIIYDKVHSWNGYTDSKDINHRY